MLPLLVYLLFLGLCHGQFMLNSYRYPYSSYYGNYGYGYPYRYPYSYSPYGYHVQHQHHQSSGLHHVGGNVFIGGGSAKEWVSCDGYHCPVHG